jgi:hypothetical protein
VAQGIRGGIIYQGIKENYSNNITVDPNYCFYIKNAYIRNYHQGIGKKSHAKA